MRKQTLKKGLAAVLGLALCVQTPAVHSVLQLSAYAQERPEWCGNLLFFGWKTGKRHGSYRGRGKGRF